MLQTKADYRVGSCYHCLINVPAGSLVAWVFVFIAIIGWATTAWFSIDKGKSLLQMIQSEQALEYDEIALIAIAVATVIIAVVFLIISTFSSQKMSRYSFSSSKKNTFGYCLSITVVVLSFLCVLFWTGIVSLTMVPISGLSILHVVVNTQSVNCIHPQSYGFRITSNHTLVQTATGVGLTGGMASGNGTELLCGDELGLWMEDAWRTLVPLLISLGFALFIEACMLGFLVAASSNARHLKERMAYINEPYNYSSENINGNAKSVNAQDKANTNNNQGDTQI